ncbi:MAG: ABC transporter ATP-binding protein [Gammaproteobacteria bacterium]|nr:ABC transporter ATP-binding protein [Gammaproteobacteria bacterium]
MSLLDVQGLTIRYGDETVVDGVNLFIDRGESVGLVGESGSGKSQSALAILGLLPRQAVASGSIEFDGQQILGASDSVLNALRARRIGIVFQDPMQALNPYLRIGAQLRQIPLTHKLRDKAEVDARVVEMLASVGLPDPQRQFRAYPHELSGGMRQRVMLASALIAEPDLLIADEPTTALDVTVQAQILDLLEDMRDNTALLLITHDLGIVAGHCEHTIVLDRGRLVEQGPTTSVFAAPSHAHTRALLAAAPRVDRGDVPEAVTGSTILSVGDAVVDYRDLQAVSKVSFSVKIGETVAVVGESGSGKSSLVRAMLGLVPMASGRVVYAGSTLEGPVEDRAQSQRRDLQLVFQDPVSALNPQMRVQTLVGEPLLVHEPQLSAAARAERVAAMLERVGLSRKFLRRFPHELSGGQAQRVAIARALILGPRVLVCDEAVAALDGSVRKQVLNVLRDVQADTGLSIIFISHDLAVVRSISHRVLVMYLGRLVEMADSETLFAAPKHPYTRALLDSVPVPDPVAMPKRAPLRGEVPSPVNPPSGCVFHPRCAKADARCGSKAPALRDVERTRVACHYPNA